MSKQAPVVYETDVTDEQYQLIAPVIERRSNRGRPTTVCLRFVLNARLYLTRPGCQWRLLPKDFPVWHSIRYSTMGEPISICCVSGCSVIPSPSDCTLFT